MKLLKKYVSAILMLCVMLSFINTAAAEYPGFKITAEFENEKPIIGENKIHIKAINYADDDVPVTVVLALYDGIQLKESMVYEEEPILSGETRKFTRSIFTTGNTEGCSLAAFFF